MKAVRRPGAAAVTLPVTLDMRNAQDFKDSLMAALERSPVLRLNGAKTRQVATPGVQILLSASQAAASGGGRLIAVNASPALQEAFHELGLEHKLKEWMAADV